MNDHDFESRWKLAARAPLPARDEAMPFGFATRVLAQWKSQPCAATIWQRLALRVCAGLALAVVALVSLEALSAGDGEALRPSIESTVDELFWAL